MAAWTRATSRPSSAAADQRLADSLRANGTPSFFINGRCLTGAQPIEKFKAEIDRALREAAQARPRGI
jgi:hypothetical protein